MKIFKFILGVILALCIGGFLFFAFVDVSVEQKQTTVSIPNETFFNDP